MEGCMAAPHWEACETCEHFGKNGCVIKEEIPLSLHLGDWILCDDYEKKTQPEKET